MSSWNGSELKITKNFHGRNKANRGTLTGTPVFFMCDGLKLIFQFTEDSQDLIASSREKPMKEVSKPIGVKYQTPR